MENKDIQFHITVKGIVIYEGKTLMDEDELEKTLDPHIFNDIKKTIEEYNQIREYEELKREAN